MVSGWVNKTRGWIHIQRYGHFVSMDLSIYYDAHTQVLSIHIIYKYISARL